MGRWLKHGCHTRSFGKSAWLDLMTEHELETAKPTTIAHMRRTLAERLFSNCPVKIDAADANRFQLLPNRAVTSVATNK